MMCWTAMPSSSILWIIVPLLASLVKCQRQVVDLTHACSIDTLYWPGVPRFNFTILERREVDNHWLESNWFSTSEHGGTHLDAPSHFYRGHPRVHQIPPERLVGPGVVIDITSQAASNPDYQVQLSDITAWELAHGRIPLGSVVMMNSNWGSRYPNRSLVFNTNTTEDPSTFRYPGWHVATVNWLATNRQVIIIGVDTPSTDFGRTPNFAVHQTLGRHNVSGLENIANLDKLPPRGMTVFVGVAKILDGSGGPARVFAMMDEPKTPCSCPRTQQPRFRQERRPRPIQSGSSRNLALTYIGFVGLLVLYYVQF
ncbi:isatin hydrolase-like [Haliotis cracherodii]|uniref:isatin hydrolase-like n=1 Tax=Haliotis cracherodii TaxID=6455 RepID=UPI0039E78993